MGVTNSAIENNASNQINVVTWVNNAGKANKYDMYQNRYLNSISGFIIIGRVIKGGSTEKR